MQLIPLLNMVLTVESPKALVALVCLPVLGFLMKAFRVCGFENRLVKLVLKVKRHD